MSGRKRNKSKNRAAIEPAPVAAAAPALTRCAECSRDGFKSVAGLKNHLRTHELSWAEYEARHREAMLDTPIEKELGIAIAPGALEQALTHRSYAYEHGGLPTNERLEFLGDSVLGVVVTTALYKNHPTLPEGKLAKLRASVVNSRALADVARGIGLGPHLRLGRGEETTGGRDKESILADTLEAVLGAIYLQYDLPVAATVIHRLFDPVMAQAARLGYGLDWKTSLQELTANRGLGVPDYHIEQTGPDHEKTFTAWAVVTGQRFGGVQGRTKKEAEQRAAETAFLALTADDVLLPEDAPTAESIVDAAADSTVDDSDDA